MTMQDAFDSFIFSRRLSGSSPKTISDYQDTIRPFVSFIGPETPLDSLHRENIQTYLSKLLKRPLGKPDFFQASPFSHKEKSRKPA